MLSNRSQYPPEGEPDPKRQKLNAPGGTEVSIAASGGKEVSTVAANMKEPATGDKAGGNVDVPAHVFCIYAGSMPLNLSNSSGMRIRGFANISIFVEVSV